MSYLNRFIIEEDIQFECNGVMGLLMEFSEDQFKRFYGKHLEILDKSKKTIVHLIIAADFGLALTRHNMLTKFLLQLPEDKEIIISRVGSQRLECIQKEQYQKFYKEGGQVKIDAPEWKTELYKSIGDDIEDFYNRVKMNEINLIMNKTYETINDCWTKIIKLISLNSSNSKLGVRSFHLSMLTDKEESEFHSKGKKNYSGKYHNLAEFRNKTGISENEQNFALSFCGRKTYYIRYDNSRCFLFDIDELDPWQEMIMKNYLESKRAKEKSLENSLSNSLYWVPESDSDLESE